MNASQIVRYVWLAVALVVLDQGIKMLVEANMPLYSQIDLFPFLALFHTRNTGIAFSFLAGIDAIWLVVLAIAIVVLMMYLALKTEPHQKLARWGFALIIGGALGNLVDRILRGHVVDYVYFHTPVWSFAVFNLADAFITIGAALMLLEELLIWKRGGSNPQ